MAPEPRRGGGARLMSHPGPAWGPSSARSRPSFLFMDVRPRGRPLERPVTEGCCRAPLVSAGQEEGGASAGSGGRAPGQACRNRPGWGGVCSPRWSAFGVCGREAHWEQRGLARGWARQGLVRVGIPNFIPASSGKPGQVGGLTPGLCSEGALAAVGVSQRRQVPQR